MKSLQLLDRYFLFEFLKYFFGALILLTGVAFISKVMETLSIVMDFKGPSRHIWSFYINNLPYLATLVTAPAMMFAVSFSVAMLSRHNELAVILAAGRSFQR